MTAAELIHILQSLPPTAPVLLRHFGSYEEDEDDTFEDIAHTEIVQVKGQDSLTIAGY